MPKYILDPVAPLSVDQALLVALCGFITVFLMLGCLAVLIVISSKIIGAFEATRKPVAAPAPKAPVAAPAAAPQEDEGELVAVLTAAIAAEASCNPDSFRITNVQSH